jgi:electron transfer flavoprotein beta subunit
VDSNTMELRIAVCIKQVPDTTEVKINPKTNTLVREGVDSIINPFDLYAIEESIRTKERYGGTVSVVSMGPPQVEVALREALSYGIDHAVLVSDRDFAGADTLATAYTLAATLRKLGGFDLLFLGRQAMDGDTGQVGPGLAENLGIPHVTEVRRVEEIGRKHITVERLLEDGYVRIRAPLPALLTVVKEINEPRMASLAGKMRSRKADIETLSAEVLQVSTERIGLGGSPTQVIKIFSPPKPQGGIVFDGPVSQSVSLLIEKLDTSGIPIRRKSGEDSQAVVDTTAGSGRGKG